MELWLSDMAGLPVVCAILSVLSAVLSFHGSYALNSFACARARLLGYTVVNQRITKFKMFAIQERGKNMNNKSILFLVADIHESRTHGLWKASAHPGDSSVFALCVLTL